MIKKFSLLVLVVISLLWTSSCNNKGVTIVNHVINQEVTTTNLENIKSLEDALCNATALAKQSVVGVISLNSLSILKQEKTGSGVVVAKKANNYYIVTNYHVISNSSGNINNLINIYLGDLDVTLNASVVTTNQKQDLALLKVETEISLGVAVITETDLRCGQYVIAIGSPYDLKKYYNTVTIGHLSSTERTIIENDVTNSYLQHDATINVGNSGGGLFNLNGELIGINTWKIDSSEALNMNFAIPAEYIKPLLCNIQ